MKGIHVWGELEKGNVNERAAAMLLESQLYAEHHSDWYLDQALRILAGSRYQEIVVAFEEVVGEPWPTGIAP